jgi:hypothetical protein
VNRVLLRINIYNGFPNDILTQAYFMEEDGLIVDSMFSEGSVPLEPGSVMGIGETINPAYRREDAIFERDRLETLQEVTTLQLQAIFLYPQVDSSLIPYYPDYHINVDVGAMFDISIQLPDEEE